MSKATCIQAAKDYSDRYNKPYFVYRVGKDWKFCDRLPERKVRFLKFVKDSLIALPTLKQLNELTCSQTLLIQLRCLMTSDLTFHYMLLPPEAIEAIVLNALSLRNIEAEDSGLSKAENHEFSTICQELAEYVAAEKDSMEEQRQGNPCLLMDTPKGSC